MGKDEIRIIWAERQLPVTADMSKWSKREINSFLRLVDRHVCGVCGSWDDDRCAESC